MEAKKKSQRILALDILRGITIAGMILVNNPGSWVDIYAPLRHAEWNGLTPTDLVFPFFMFMMGISTYISLKKFHFAFSAAVGRKIIRRTVLIFVIGMAIAILGQFMGVNAVIYYGPTIFKNVGLEDPLLGQVWIGVVNCVTTIIAIFVIDKVGRKGLVYFGVTGMIISLILAAGFLHFKEQWQLNDVLMIVFLGAYMFCQAISISAIIFVILSEMYPNKVRGLAMSIASMSLWIANWVVSQIFPNLLEALTLEGTFLLFAACCVPYILIMWKLVPETTGKTLEEIEAYWLKEDIAELKEHNNK